MFKWHLEKRVKQYVEKGECDEPVEGKLKHFTKQYEKMHWVAAVTPQDYVDRLTQNFPALVLEARRGYCRSPGKHHMRGSRCSSR